MKLHSINAIAFSVVLMFSSATLACAKSLSQQDDLQLTSMQNFVCESTQPSYLSKPLVKQIKVSASCVEGQSTENPKGQLKVCSLYFDSLNYKTAINNQFQVSHGHCFDSKPLKNIQTN